MAGAPASNLHSQRPSKSLSPPKSQSCLGTDRGDGRGGTGVVQAAAVVAVLYLVVLPNMVVPSCFPYARRRRRQRKDAFDWPPLLISERRYWVNPDLCRTFTLAEMKKATNNFHQDLRIGVGGFGNVYRGVIDGGATEVAIKRFNCYSRTGQGFSEFQAEIEMLSKLRHRHLVSLIGCCLEDSEMIIVYEYMAHGSLCQHLYQSQVPPHGLPWNLRLQICIGAARGFHYLHSEATNHDIIHRGVKSMDILLDSNWDAKIAGFGLSLLGSMEENDPVSTTLVGTSEYLDPEYILFRRLSEKTDVYSFGVVLLEVLCTRGPIDSSLPGNHTSLVQWALHCLKNGIDVYSFGVVRWFRKSKSFQQYTLNVSLADWALHWCQSEAKMKLIYLNTARRHQFRFQNVLYIDYFLPLASTMEMKLLS
ncbi:hypothetical protein ACLOJK_031539 [Asimina triloba]